ncbi:2'-5' RNA ligase family protein [Nocardioides acrostichi]|uniref:2'-5' RNA ligase family protein n=1 Tax=Nocardioides acrostichi TaxID=2784339 RepID=A0A930V3S9_9ACTN|nr:2'-5' RNA ligase family protein [Nocardioides acrostichi]MBF4162694.1 2'-5' RNA ligase family protein [Nocardioides acrostichi]
MSEPSGWGARGHTVLAVPVPALDPWVRERTRHHDPSFVSDDAGFVHAHVTLLAPWLPDPSAADLAAVARVLAGWPAFDVRLARVAAFPDGLLHLVPEPAEPLAELGRRLAAAFPQCPPYAGRHPAAVPHLTLDQRTARTTAASVTASLGDLLPVRHRVDRVDLQRWANHGCRLLHAWALDDDRAVVAR